VATSVGDLDAREVHVLHGDVERLARRVADLAHHERELVVLDDDGLHRHARGELDLLQHLLVGRVRHADEDAVAALAQRDHAVRRGDLRVDQVGRQVLDIDRIEVEERIAEGLRREERDVFRRDLLRLDELLDEREPALARLRLDGVGIRLHETALLDQCPAEGAKSGGLGRHRIRSTNQRDSPGFAFSS
jgi:hypothetical protein